MKYSFDSLKKVASKVGESFYLLDSEQFEKNCTELIDAFRAYYPNSYIAYSYKTNYIPKLCKIVNDIGGYAEIVSKMELTLAQRIGVQPDRIIFNGPYKDMEAVKSLLLDGGCVNVDSLEELKELTDFAQEHQNNTIHLGIRCNFDIQDGLVSRFGIDTGSSDFEQALQLVERTKNVVFEELHFHYAIRTLEAWKSRIDGLEQLLSKYPAIRPRHIDLGGGLYGKMADSLKEQFDCPIPTYKEYAEIVAKRFAHIFHNSEYKPDLFIEPGSAVSGDCMGFAVRVKRIKSVRGKAIATVLGSMYNINPTLNKKNPPIEVVHDPNGDKHYYKDIDLGGYTCIESDYIYRHYQGELAVGDYVVFGNAGSYSIVLKPPFILPNFAIVDVENGEEIEIVKQRETFDDIFHTYLF